jgi:flagellar biosynthesis protein FliR
MPVYGVALRRFPCAPRLALAFAASLITHPLVWAFVSTGEADEYWARVALSEIFAVLTEAAYLHALAAPTALGWSILANGLSIGLGLLCRSVWGIP